MRDLRDVVASSRSPPRSTRRVAIDISPPNPPQFALLGPEIDGGQLAGFNLLADGWRGHSEVSRDFFHAGDLVHSYPRGMFLLYVNFELLCKPLGIVG
jgi:hypothetical protein